MSKKTLTQNDIDSILKVVVSAEDKSFFSNAFTEKPIIMDLLAYRFSYGEPSWLNSINEGRLYIREDIESKKIKGVNYFENWCRKNNIEESSVLALYVEKMRPNRRCIITDDGRIFVGDEIIDRDELSIDKLEGMSVNGENRYDLCVSISFKHFLNNLLALPKYQYNIIYFNPVSKSSFAERENYIEYILAFFIEYGGLNARQIFHITDMLRNFEMSSQTAQEIITILFKYRHYSLAQATNETLLTFDESVTNYLLIDILYLIDIGGYDCGQKYNMQADIAERLKTPLERVMYTNRQIEKEMCLL